jgi:hypothetical protein
MKRMKVMMKKKQRNDEEENQANDEKHLINI